eukprot:jgi/Tetstr1/426175/TSEL_016500.t1
MGYADGAHGRRRANGGRRGGGRGCGATGRGGGQNVLGGKKQPDGSFTIHVTTLKGQRFDRQVRSTMTVLELKGLLAPDEPESTVKIIVGSTMMSSKKPDGSDYRIGDGPYHVSPNKNNVKLVKRFDGGAQRSGIREVCHQLKWMTSESLGNNFIGVEPMNDGWAWNVLMRGPQRSPYQQHIFEVNIQFPSDYPEAPPTIKFVTPIFHPNVYSSGLLCWHDNDTSGSVYYADMIFAAVLALMQSPNPYSPANSEAARLYTSDQAQYRKQAREHAIRHALS